MRARGVMTAYIGWMTLLAVAYFMADSPRWSAVLWGLVSLSGSTAMFWGIARNRPRRPGPWRLLAAGLLFLGIGDTWTLVLIAGEPAYGVPIAIHLCYAVMFCLVFSGLIGLARTGLPERDRAGLLDAFTLAAGVGLLSWIYLIAPRLTDPQLSLVNAATVIAYPIGMLLILAMAVRLGAGMRPGRSLYLLIAGAVSLSFGEAVFLTSMLNGRWSVGTWADVFWLLFYVCWGSAALHPSMAQLSEPRLTRSGDLNVWRLTLLSFCSLIPSVVLIVMASRGTVRFDLVLGLASAVMVLLVLARLLGVLRQQRRALARERQLRRAGAELVAVTNTADLDRLVTGVVRDLMPAGASHHTVLVLGPWPGGDDDGSRLRATAELPVPYAVTMRPYEKVLSCPLAVADRPDSGAELGRLLVGAAVDVLVRLHGAVEILAVQAAMALTRIQLTVEINKRDSEDYFRALVHNATDVILIIDEDGMIRYQSPSAFLLIGDRVLQGRSISDLVPPDRRELAEEIFARIVHGEPVSNNIDWMIQATDGRMLQVSASWRDLRGDPTVAGIVVTLRDVTEQRRLERELTHRAYHDPLTGLPNRALFAEEVSRAGGLARAEGTVAGVLFVDLDNFKEVNDTLGHLVGDQLLVAVAGRLTASVRPADMAARLGGDEFAVLVRHAAGSAAVEDIADRVVSALSTPIVIGPHLVHASGSVGVATTAESVGADLLRDADRALYLAKEAGKGGWHRYTSADRNARGDLGPSAGPAANAGASA